MGQLFWSSSKQSVLATSTHDIEICEVHMDLNVADLLTKNLSRKQNMISSRTDWMLIT